MKTSNKLLLGLFGLVFLGMIVFNFFLTKEIKNAPIPNNQMNMNPVLDSLLIDIDTTKINYN